jgi:hypothetical protein
MFNSQVLEVGIGLILCFLLVSLILTAVRETVEAFMKSRAVDLERALAELLKDEKGDGLRKAFYDHPLISSLYRGNYVPTEFDGLKTSSTSSSVNPAYIPRRQFALALLDLVEQGKAGGPVANAVGLLRESVSGDIEQLRLEIESWYDGAMDRASGWYRRRTQWILLFLGLVVAVGLNVNAVTIAESLSTNTTQRELILQRAGGVNEGTSPDELNELLAQVELPIGWSQEQVTRMGNSFTGANVFEAFGIGLSLLFGWLVTGLAATLGAPFWFDVLNKFMVIRSTVKPAEKSGDEGSEDRPSGDGSRSGTAPAQRTTGSTASGPEADRIAGNDYVYG